MATKVLLVGYPGWQHSKGFDDVVHVATVQMT
jgi:hypothetical protein